MIKFFRHIRKTLLADGKFRKYLLYAIGEILLVVVGILIALQINNWNNQRSNDKIEQQYMQRLINELEEEKSRFQNLKDGFARQNQAVLNLLTIWNDEQLVVNDTTQFWRDFFAGSGAGPWYKEPVIWTQLVQSGELKLIRDQEAVEALFKHYADVKSFADNYAQYPTQTTNETRKLIAETFAETDYLLTPGTRARPKPPAEMLQAVRERKGEYRVTFVRTGIIARIHDRNMQSLVDSAQECIDLLNKNLVKNE